MLDIAWMAVLEWVRKQLETRKNGLSESKVLGGRDANIMFSEVQKGMAFVKDTFIKAQTAIRAKHFSHIVQRVVDVITAEGGRSTNSRVESPLAHRMSPLLCLYVASCIMKCNLCANAHWCECEGGGHCSYTLPFPVAFVAFIIHFNVRKEIR